MTAALNHYAREAMQTVMRYGARLPSRYWRKVARSPSAADASTLIRQETDN